MPTADVPFSLGGDGFGACLARVIDKWDAAEVPFVTQKAGVTLRRILDPGVCSPCHPMLTHFDHVFGRSYFHQTDDSEAETSPIERSRRAESIPAISRSDSTNAKSSEATGPPQAPKFSQKIN